jgi:hypothetical protein
MWNYYYYRRQSVRPTPQDLVYNDPPLSKVFLIFVALLRLFLCMDRLVKKRADKDSTVLTYCASKMQLLTYQLTILID